MYFDLPDSLISLHLLPACMRKRVSWKRRPPRSSKACRSDLNGWDMAERSSLAACGFREFPSAVCIYRT
jgi:hypothetical protein